MTAVYSDYVFKDLSLYEQALELQAQFDLTLVMGLDVAWVPDGLQRDGEHVREPVDNLIRQAMSKKATAFQSHLWSRRGQAQCRFVGHQ
jgi:nicotinamide riboside kinase